jgi:two-component system, sensor histidine kinase and response regulator
MNNYSILVIDDQPENFEVIEALLENMNYTLSYASGGKAAIDSLDKFDPDLILLDVMMPEIDGIEVCKQIKAIPRWQAVPIIMITSLSSTENLAHCLTTGADDFLSKPVNGVELRARVHSMLRIKKQHDRIESLSKLQRNSIGSLKNTLDELNSDLAISFPKESDTPLHNILDKIQLLQQDFHKMSLPKIRELLESANSSAIELDQFHQSFLFTRQLSSSIPVTGKQEICSAKIAIEQITTRQIDQSQSPLKLIFDIEDADLAVTPKHLQYIVVELLEYIIKISTAKDFVNIHGHIVNDEFHFYIDNRKISINSIPLAELSAAIKFNIASSADNELTKGLKIAKKIVEIHEGIFLIGNSDLNEATIYITLPLTRFIAPPHPSMVLVTNQGVSISDELQESWHE